MSEGVDVYILQAKDLFRFALCFGKSVFEFTTQDERGPVSCFSPHSATTPEGIIWRTSSRVKISEDLNSDEWSNAVHCAVLTRKQFSEYRDWLQNWLEENSYYTVLEGGSNVRKFVTDSLTAMQRLGAQMAKSHLFLPEVCTYVLEYSVKEACSASDIQSIAEWYGDKQKTDLHRTVQSLNSSEFAYYHESSAWGERYWSVLNPRFRLQGGKIKLPNDGAASATVIRSVGEEDNVLSRLRRGTTDNATAATDNATVSGPISVALPISVAAPIPITTIPVFAALTPAGDNSMLVIIILVAVLILIIFFAIVYYASYRNTRVVRSPVAFVTPMAVSV